MHQTHNYLVKIILASLLFYNVTQAQAADGSILSVNSNTVTARLNPGVIVNRGDELNVSLNLGGDVLQAGKLRVENVQGDLVTSRIIERQMAVQKGMLIDRLNYTSPSSNTTASTSNWQNPDLVKKERVKPVKKESSIELLDFGSSSNDGTVTEIVTRRSTETILTRTTTSYSLVWKDSGSGARVDFATFRPSVFDGYYPVGDVAITAPWQRGRYAPPVTPSLLVKDGAIKLARPSGYIKTWDSRRSRSDIDFSTWEPVPQPGYTCLGEVGIASLNDMPSIDAIRCVPQTCAMEVPLGNQIWKDSGSGAKLDFSAWAVPGLTTYIGYASHKKPQRTAYTIKQECLN
jgi:hypothetical protein